MKPKAWNRDVTLEFVVGAFMFMVLMALGYFTIVLGQRNIFRERYAFEATFNDVIGLRDGDNVVMRGTTIGKVTRCTLEGQRVRVQCMLDTPVRLKRDYRVRIVSTSILGGRYLEIQEGSAHAPVLEASLMPQGEDPHDLMAEATIILTDLRRWLTEGNVLTNLSETVSELRGVSEKLNRGQGTIGRLIADDTVYNDLESVMKDTRATMSQLREVTEKVGRGEGTVGKLLNDEAVYNDLKALAANMRELSDRLDKGEGTLGRLMASDDAMYVDLSNTVASLKVVAARLENGEGTVGKLLTDDSLYTDAGRAVRDLRAAIDDFRETSPVVSFSSLLFGAF